MAHRNNFSAYHPFLNRQVYGGNREEKKMGQKKDIAGAIGEKNGKKLPGPFRSEKKTDKKK